MQPENQTHPEYYSSEKTTYSVNTYGVPLHSSPKATAYFSQYSHQPQHFFDPWQISQDSDTVPMRQFSSLPFLGEGKKKNQNKNFFTISVACLSLNIPSQPHMKQQCVYLFLHSVCQCGLWYHRVFAETPQLNLRVVIHRRQNCPDLWMKNILNCPGQLMHCQFYKEKNIFLM